MREGMTIPKGGTQMWRGARLRLALAALVFAGTVPPLDAGGNEKEGWDSYKLRVDAFWFNANPSGTLEGAGHNGIIDRKRDFGLSSYPTFTGKLDWKFTRKNHLLFALP